MSPPLILALPGNVELAKQLAALLGGEMGGLEVHAFPDGETGLRLQENVAGREVILACTLAQPDGKFLPLAFAAAAARAQGACRCCWMT